MLAAAAALVLGLGLALAAIPVVHALGGDPGRIQDVGLLTAQTARTDGYNHLLVTVGKTGGAQTAGTEPRPDPVAAGWPRDHFF